MVSTRARGSAPIAARSLTLVSMAATPAANGSASTKPGSIASPPTTTVAVVNVGLSLFAEAVAAQGRPVADVDWRIPAGGDLEAVAALRRLYGPRAAAIDAANAEVVRRLDRGVPLLVGLAPAAGVVP